MTAACSVAFRAGECYAASGFKEYDMRSNICWCSASGRGRLRGRHEHGSCIGQVMLDGKPLPNANVVFEHDSTRRTPARAPREKPMRTASSPCIDDGKANGALVGKYKVSITAYAGKDGIPSSGSDMIANQILVGEKYNSKNGTAVRGARGGSTSANFDLTSDEKK